MKVDITIDREFKGLLTAVWLRKTARAILIAENASTKTEMGLVVTGQEKIRELNKQYLDEDAPTDVLSFPLIEADHAGFINPPDGIVRLGEVIISYPQAAKQATAHRHAVEKEVAVLIIHGILHLLGYDHDIPVRKRIMRARETAILKTIEESLL